VRTSIDRQQVKTVVIDSLNGYQAAMPEEQFLVLHIHELLQYLNRQGSRPLCPSPSTAWWRHEVPVDVTYLADTVILLRYFEAFGEVRRAISIIKKRFGSHQSSIREFRVGSSGIFRRRASDGLSGHSHRRAAFAEKIAINCSKSTDRGRLTSSNPERALILAPVGAMRLWPRASCGPPGSLWRSARISRRSCVRSDGVLAFALVTEEALRAADLRDLSTWLSVSLRGRTCPSSC
jgi:hypothetical protein